MMPTICDFAPPCARDRIVGALLIPAISSARSNGTIRRLAEREGLARPFEILVSMDGDSRARVAAHLGVAIDHLGDDAAREAWAILHRDLKGMQARGHVVFERVLPIRNITWIEMLRRTARWLRLPADGSVFELERRIYETFADRIVATWNTEEVSLCDAMATVEPWVLRLRERIALSKNGIRLAVRTFPSRAWIEFLGAASAVAQTQRVRGISAQFTYRIGRAVDRVASAAPLLRVPLRAIAQLSYLVSLILVPHHAHNAPVVVTLVLQSFQRTAAEPTMAFWHSV
ncbi:MAG: hypothetical protein HY286_10860 [Planctomycetes bacterium]|nr:hypothetical protein [Planctomycetota bacterium]